MLVLLTNTTKPQNPWEELELIEEFSNNIKQTWKAKKEIYGSPSCKMSLNATTSKIPICYF